MMAQAELGLQLGRKELGVFTMKLGVSSSRRSPFGYLPNSGDHQICLITLVTLVLSLRPLTME
jgi:hypothetical protein